MESLQRRVRLVLLLSLGQHLSGERDGIRRPVHFFDYEGVTIWGATARILRQYLDLVG